MASSKRGPRFPLYIPSKGRFEYMVTSRVLTEMGLPHFIIVEPQQLKDYQRAVKAMRLSATLLELDLDFKSRYELCDSLGLSKSTDPGPARNFAWEHAKTAGAEWHWVMDDNISAFMRLHANLRVKVTSPSFWRAMEDFALRYKNVAMAGPAYSMFAISSRMSRLPPFVLNTRIYSCNLIRNDIPMRWRGRYNEDTILSLDMLKAGWCTVQFNAFLQQKMNTQALPGGNTEEFYHAEGKVETGKAYADGSTKAKSEMLVRVHPDCARLVWKFHRVHHHVDYYRFKSQKLIRKADLQLPEAPNEYGLRLMKVAQ